MARVVWKSSNQTKENRRVASRTEWIKLTLSTGFIILVMFVFSIGLTFYQRWFLQRHKLPLTVVSCHLIIKFLLSALFRHIFQYVTGKKRITLNWSTNFIKLAPVGFSAGLDVGFSNWGLELITVSLYTMTKSTSIIFILFFAILFKQERKTCSVFLIVFMIATGLLLFTYESTQFNFTGFLLVLFASFMSGLRWTMAQFVMMQTNLELKNPVDMMYHVQLWMFLLIGPLSALIEGTPLKAALEKPNSVFELVVLVVSGAMIAFALEIAEFLVLTHTSSLTLAVSGIVKEICTLVLAYEWNGDKMTLVNFFGLLLCLGGIISHVIYKAQLVEYNRRETFGEDDSVRFLPVMSESSDDENTTHADHSSTEELFNVLNIVERPK